jgi:hypothetical protein
MRKIVVLVAAAWALSVAVAAPASAEGSCYRWGETGFHKYDFCLGPWFLYPHDKVCDKAGICWYR